MYLMVAVPTATPVTTPVVIFTEAIPLLMDVHVPPDVAEVSDVEAPTHTLPIPEIAAGSGLTVTTAVR